MSKIIILICFTFTTNVFSNEVIVNHVIKDLNVIENINNLKKIPCKNNELDNPIKFIENLKSVTENGKKVSCKPRVIDGCGFDECIAPAGLFNNYPKPVTILIPKNLSYPKSLKVHFHGFSYFGKKWDKNIESMNSSFKFGVSTCKKKDEIILIPYSENNKNNDFHKYFPNSNKFISFLNEVEIKSIMSNKLPITLSAHSGGGKVIANIVKDDTLVNRIGAIELYDALYSKYWADNIYNWVDKNQNAKLKIASIKNTTTSTWSNYLYKKIESSISSPVENRINNETNRMFEYRTKDKDGRKISLSEEKYRQGDHHWELNRDFWNLSIH